MSRRAGDTTTALHDLDHAAELDPHEPSVAFVRAQAHRDQANWDEAERAWRAWSAMAPQTTGGWALRADILEGQGRGHLALGALDAAMAIQANPDLALRRARLAIELGETERAAMGLSETAEALGAPVLRLELFELEMKRDQPGAALAVVDELLTIVPDHPQWLGLRADALVALERHSEARTTLEGALARLDEQLAKRPTPQRQAVRDTLSRSLEALR